MSDVSEKYKVLSQRYVNALVQIANENDDWALINDDLTNIIKTFEDSSDLENFFIHPVISNNDKIDVLSRIFKKSVSKNVYNLLNLLIDKNRMYILPTINSIFKEEFLKQNNIINIHVCTAVELKPELEQRMVEKLEQKFNKKVKLQVQIDEEIIAGAVLKFDDKVVDGSIRTKLEKLKQELL